MIAIVVAYAKNRTIGKDNDLPWYIPEDLKHFKALTAGNTVIMGRNTYASILKRLNGPLPNRRNIVVSTSLESVPEGVEVAVSLDKAIELSREEAYIIGGARLYQASFNANLVDEIYATEIDAEIAGDTFFPELTDAAWLEVSREPQPQSDKSAYSYAFVKYVRKGKSSDAAV